MSPTSILLTCIVTFSGHLFLNAKSQEVFDDIIYQNQLESQPFQEDFPWPLLDTNTHQFELPKAKRSTNGRGRRTSRDIPIYIDECLQVVANPGTYIVRPPNPPGRACGVYLAGMHNEIITVDISFVDVSCDSDGVVAFFDGWEMNGHIFPSEFDHSHVLNERVVSLCKETFPRRRKLRLRSSQNVALLQYRILQPGEGFVFKVTMEHNDDPCNVLMTESKSKFTLTNSGRKRNCSVTAVLNPPNLKLVHFQIGKPTFESSFISPCYHDDYVDIGGASNLDPSLMEVKESVCGHQPAPAKKGLTILCDSSSVRLVSSGRHDNYVTINIKAATDEDMKYDDNIVMMCPGYL